jgi:hypothetical protein
MKSLLLLAAFQLASAADPDQYSYRLLATSKTSTMEKEMNEAAAGGYVFASVMGGDTALGGKEAVVVMQRPSSGEATARYKLLATSKTSTMEKELNEAGVEGFEYRGQTVFASAFGGNEVVTILERNANSPHPITYRLLATSKTSTMQKELDEAGKDGFRLLGMTVSKTAFRGSEVVCILGKTGK